MVRIAVKSRWFGMFLFTFPALADTGPCLILNAQSLSVSRDTIERAWDLLLTTLEQQTYVGTPLGKLRDSV